MHNWTFLLGPGFADGVGTGLILGWLMYRSGLVGRRMALVGVVGGAMLATSGVAVLLGVIPQGGAVQGIATDPGDHLGGVPGPVPALQGLQAVGPGRARAPTRATGQGSNGHPVTDRRRDEGWCGMTAVGEQAASDLSTVVRPDRLGAAPRALPAQRGADRPHAAEGRRQVRDDAPHDARATLGPAASRDRRATTRTARTWSPWP